MLQPAQLSFTTDGTPWSEQYQDVYASQAGALAQAEHVFLHGNDLPQGWQQQQRFVILETGFGLGNNFLATWQAWRTDPQRCRRLWFVSLEKHPLTLADLQRVHHTSPLKNLAYELAAQWPLPIAGLHRLEFERGAVQLLLVWGDAATWLPQLQVKADAFYLDGFSPSKNPALWDSTLMQQLSQHAQPGATAATYTVARPVREALSQAGFVVQKRPGFAQKREMTVAHWPGEHEIQAAHDAELAKLNILPILSTSTVTTKNFATSTQPPTACIIGAGLAGCAAANRLAARGFKVTVVDALPGLAQATSSNRMGAVQPVLTQGDTPAAQFTRAAYFETLHTWERLKAQGQTLIGEMRGLLHLAKDDGDATKMQTLLAQQAWPEEFVRWVNVEEASALAGVPVARGGYWFSQAGWLQPASYCTALINEYVEQITLRFNTRITQLDDVSADVIVLANAEAAIEWLAPIASQLKLHTVRGQLSHISSELFNAPRVPVAGDGYVMPAYQGISVVGATYEHDHENDATAFELRFSSHAENIQRLQRLLVGQKLEASTPLAGRAGLRTVRPSRLPLVGSIPNTRNVYVLTALGSRGITWAALCGEWLAAHIAKDPCQPPSLYKALNP